MLPLAIAALPIPSTVLSQTLTSYLEAILDCLFDHDIQVVSYASDGSAVELSLQANILTSMTESRVYCITHPTSTHSNEGSIVFRLGFYHGYPLMMVQDSKHFLKTCCNNLFSGACLLVFGSFFAIYSQAREIAFDSSLTLC